MNNKYLISVISFYHLIYISIYFCVKILGFNKGILFSNSFIIGLALVSMVILIITSILQIKRSDYKWNGSLIILLGVDIAVLIESI